MDEELASRWRRTSLELPEALIKQLEELRREWGLRHRGAVLERLLQQIFEGDGEQEPLPEKLEDAQQAPVAPPDLDDSLALVLVGRGALQALHPDHPDQPPLPTASRPRRGGIDLPGFVQRRTGEIRRGLRSGVSASASASASAMPSLRLSEEELAKALCEARDHWIHLYGTPPSPTVLENAMIWLAKDIWPHSDQSEGRLFTWTAACQLMSEFAPSWSDSPPSFERVMVIAGVLEDPFSASTLQLRLPTLIRRFVQRFRRRSRGTSFQTLEHTMTLQGALKLLQLPTHSGQRLSLREIREAYREMALSHHPDAGGSPESMRRINEAYQLLKELYRDPPPTQEG